MRRIIVSTLCGIVGLVIIAPIFSGIISSLAKDASQLTWLSQIASIALVPALTGFFTRRLGAVVGFVLSLTLIGSILIVWLVLLNLSINDILNNLITNNKIVFEFIAYMVIGTTSGWLGNYFYKRSHKV